MIRNFKHKGLSRLFIDDDKSGINAQHRERIFRLLDRLDCSAKVSGNWRLTFRFDGINAYDVNLEDYH